jgi:hypothetical protein
MSSSVPILPSAAITVWWLQGLGLLLAGLGTLLFGTGMWELAAPVVPTHTVPNHMAADATTTVVIALPARSLDVGTGARGGEWSGPRETGLSRRERSQRPADCLGSDLAAGRRGESTHLATVEFQGPDECGDIRDSLMEVASAHDWRNAMNSRPCVLTGLACHGPGEPRSDDRIGNALFGPALLQSRALSSGVEHESTPAEPPEGWDIRWDLFEMAGAKRGEWTQRCPCPVYPIDNPLKRQR